MIEYLNLDDELKIVMISPSGNLLCLEDGSRWQLVPSRRINLAWWLVGETVTVFDPGYKKKIPCSEYKIKNVTRNEVVASFLVRNSQPKAA